MRTGNSHEKNSVHGNARISAELVELIHQGVCMSETMEGAAAFSGVSRPTIWRWSRRGEAEIRRLDADPDAETRESDELYVDLFNALTHARARKTAHDLAVISHHAYALGDWRASAWRLERRYPERWGKRRRVELEHTGAGGGPVRFTEEKEE
jgi:hypothetical protein